MFSVLLIIKILTFFFLGNFTYDDSFFYKKNVIKHDLTTSFLIDENNKNLGSFDSTINLKTDLYEDSYTFEFHRNEEYDDSYEFLLHKQDSNFVLVGENNIVILNDDFSHNSKITIERKKLEKNAFLNHVILDGDEYLFVFSHEIYSSITQPGRRNVILEKIDSTGKVLWTETLEKVGNFIKSKNSEFFILPEKEKVTVFSKSGKRVNEYAINDDFFEFKVTDTGTLIALQITDNELFLVNFSNQNMTRKLAVPFGMNLSQLTLDISPMEDFLVLSSLIAYQNQEKSKLSKIIFYDHFKAVGANIKIIRISDFKEIQDELSIFAQKLDPNDKKHSEYINSKGVEFILNRGVLFRNNDIVLQLEKSITIASTSGHRFYNWDLILIKVGTEGSKAVVFEKNSSFRFIQSYSSFFSYSDHDNLILCYNELKKGKVKNQFYLQVFDTELNNVHTQTFNTIRSIPSVNQSRIEILNFNGNFYFKVSHSGLYILKVEKTSIKNSSDI